MHRLWLCIVIFTLLLGNPGSAMAKGMLGPEGANAAAISNVFLFVVAVCTVIFFSVSIPLVIFIYRFRERLDDGETEPPQIYGSEPIEVAWTLAPAMVVMVIGLVTVRSIIDLREIPSGPHAEKVRVVGHQWWWEFEYPGYGFTTANEMVIPVSTAKQARPIALQLESADVIHSFWVPSLAGKTDNVPGKTNRMWIQGDVETTYSGRCAEYCGTQHTKMLFRVDVVSEEKYEQWLKHQQQPAIEDPAVSKGRDRFMAMACANCHTIRGLGARGKFGPDLTHLMSRSTIGAGIVENNAENLTTWLKTPEKFKAGCYMPNMRMSDEDTKLIADYLLTLE